MKKLNFKTIESGRKESKLVSFLPECILTDEEKKSLKGGDGEDSCITYSNCSTGGAIEAPGGREHCDIKIGSCGSKGWCINYTCQSY